MNEASDTPLHEEKAPIPLVRRADFRLGNAIVKPSLRTISGPSGEVKGEPRVIRVLVALADARGRVLSRDDLLRLCWDSRIVGDDAINRAVAEVRRIAASAGANFEVETVARVGYRLSHIDWEEAKPSDPAEPEKPLFTRRKAIAAAAGAAGLLVAGGAAIVYRNRGREIDALIERGRVLQASGQPDGERRAEALIRRAIEQDPGRAEAWGWLSVILLDANAQREAALHAIALDPKEPNARAVLAYQRWDLDSWTKWEDQLLEVLSDAPGNAFALSNLTLFYQGMGRCRDSWRTNERALASEPFNPAHHHRRALKHWIFGRIGEADKVIDRALELWPRSANVWNARMVIYAFTDRAEAALVLLDDRSSRPTNLTEHSILSWRAGLTAIATRRSEDVARAVETCTSTARLAPGLAANAIMIFSHLSETDAAYRVAEGLFQGRGEVVQQSRGRGIRDVYSSSAWGRTQFLFIPAANAFRQDLRFPDLCRRMGHVAYWKNRGIWPDAFVRGAIKPSELA